MLDERAAILFKIILFSPVITIRQLEIQTNSSRRQVNYDLQKINDWLTAQELPPITNRRGSGLFVQEKIKQAGFNLLPSVKVREYIPSQDLRTWLILIQVFIKADYLSVNHLTDSLSVSRNTVLADIKDASEMANRYHTALNYNRQEGYYLSGDENNIRILVVKCISGVLQQTNGMSILAKVYDEREGEGAFNTAFENAFVSLSKLEEHLQVAFVEERLKELTVFFTLLLIRIQEKHSIFFPIEVSQTIKDTADYKTVKELLRLLQVELSEEEVIYLTIQLLGLNVRYDHQLFQTPTDNELYRLIDDILLEFEILACVTFTDREQAKKSLMVHLKPAYYRLIFDVPIVNPYLDKIKEEHFDLFILVKRSLKKLEELVKSPISDDEVGYIALHFGSFLNEKGLPVRRKKAIIICPNGLGTSNMLKVQIEKLVPEIEMIGVISLREYAYRKMDNFDMVFSTVMLQTKKPLIIVNPILTSLDKAKIIQEVDLILHGMGSHHPNVNNLMQVIKLFSTVHDEKGLVTSITNLLIGSKVESIGRYKPVLTELLTKEMIQLADCADSWEKAIQLAAQPLLDVQAIEPSYIEAMVDNINKMGAYIVLAPKVAIPHARPEEGVKKLGMSLLKLDQPVSFQSGNPEKDVNLIIVLAAIDNETHLKALSQLTELLEEETNILEIIAAKNIDSIIPLIEQYGK
ncbi:transcription antiterminator [Bacillus sp. C30]|uniref:BglG family transcription antiterminator n=1 Tax=Bacillus sp. C30 TaxID=1387733 RepID=UPI00349F9686